MSQTKENPDVSESEDRDVGIIDSTKKFIQVVFQAGCEYIKETNLIENIRKRKSTEKV